MDKRTIHECVSIGKDESGIRDDGISKIKLTIQISTTDTTVNCNDKR